MLLDWEKAFDKGRQDAIPVVMERFKIDKKLIGLTAALYRNPTFLVEEMGQTSTKRTQETGIRQGCPLSPYLFLSIMAATIEDAKKRSQGDSRMEGKAREQQGPKYKLQRNIIRR